MLCRLDPDIVEYTMKIQRRRVGAVFQEVRDMLYEEDAGIVSQSPRSLGNIMEVMVRVFTASGGLC